jgi:AbrB family looped-hinge helix DNA binding protein
MRITTKGQVTIPVELREQAGLLPLTEVEFGIVDGVVTLRPAVARDRPDRGAEIVRHLRGRLRDSGSIRMTTDEIMALTRGAPDDA